MYSLLRNTRLLLSQGKIFWREVGVGPHLVFLHGSWHDSNQWLPIIENLSKDNHCLAPDLLGFGDSEFPNVHHSIDLATDCLAEYLDALKLEKVYLVAHSLGAWVAASYALKHLDRVEGLILIAPEGVEVPSTKGRRLWARVLGNPLFLPVWLLRSLFPLARLLGLGKQLKSQLQLRLKMRFSPTANHLLFRRRWAEIQAELLTEHLSYLKVPTLILQGSEDSPIALSMSEAYADLAPMAKLQIIEESNNNLVEERPEAIAQYIRDFFGNC
ncbi:MAG: alpha/beta hydrolase [Cyanobacteriota bacterium]|nr:alpha/beta hydrolase [Cyanobacteriota bacterium]